MYDARGVQPMYEERVSESVFVSTDGTMAKNYFSL